MKLDIDFKRRLLAQMNAILSEKISIVEMSIAETNESMKNDTKSSAGDKFETGREMMQIELNNKQVQLAKLKQTKSDLNKIDVSSSAHKVGFGSLVQTNMGLYFIAVALGKVKADDAEVYSISLASPIGKILKDKSTSDTLIFNGKTIVVEDLI